MSHTASDAQVDRLLTPGDNYFRVLSAAGPNTLIATAVASDGQSGPLNAKLYPMRVCFCHIRQPWRNSFVNRYFRMDEAPAGTFDAEDDTMPLLLRFDDDCLQSEVIHSTFFYSVFIMDTKSRMVKFALATEPCGTSCPYEARIPDFL